MTSNNLVTNNVTTMDPWVSAGIDAGAQLIGAGISFLGNNKINKDNLDYLREYNDKVMAMTYDLNDINYQRQLAENNLTRAREDTAVQRAAADMQKAGLSKTLAAGNSASSASMNSARAEIPNITPLKNDMKFDNFLKDLNIAQSAMAFKQMQADYDLSLAQKELVDAQAREADSNAGYHDTMSEKLRAEIEQIPFETQKIIAETGKIDKEICLKVLEIDEQRYQNELLSIDLSYAPKEKALDVQKLNAEVNHLIAERDLDVQKIAESKNNMKKVSAEIAESIARTNNLKAENEQILADVVEQKLQNLADSYDFIRNANNGTSSTGAKSFLGNIAQDFANVFNGTFGGLFNKANRPSGQVANANAFLQAL